MSEDIDGYPFTWVSYGDGWTLEHAHPVLMELLREHLEAADLDWVVADIVV